MGQERTWTAGGRAGRQRLRSASCTHARALVVAVVTLTAKVAVVGWADQGLPA